MTQDEIIRIAQEAGFAPSSSTTVLPMKDYASHGVSYELERFYQMAFAAGAAHERKKFLNRLDGVSEKVIYETVKEAVLAEREACAKVCEDIDQRDDIHPDHVAIECAAAIRARSENGTA